jgi:hypothetical protein
MMAGRNRICSRCGQAFQVTDNEFRDEQAGGYLVATCSSCHGNALAVRMSSDLAKRNVPMTRIHWSTVGADDLQRLLRDALSPLSGRTQTLWEKLLGIDPRTDELRQRLDTTKEAIDLTRHRTTLIRELHAMVVATRDLDDIERETDRRAVQARIDLLRVELERMQIEDDIASWPATRQSRLENQRLESVRRQRELLDTARPSRDDARTREKRSLADERARRKIHASARQQFIADCLSELERLHRADLDPYELMLRMRAVMDAYGMETDDLPRHLQQVLTGDYDDDEFEDVDDEEDR